ncbi:MAG: bifunctional 4-hydroxy-2-oxoglutarate aldolase/2-dehydro-3-deoxy-phosphogluconate aldolase [Clostridia bacterium]|nr:bifunctional 4-hydroxy-2-oxoglutarate aldolase/2-dehydro-3-deoxy-phosphogluconate aldolase [Clostridia bacterium]
MNNVEFIKENGLIVIFRGVDISLVPDLVNAIYKGGVRIVETTFDPSDPDTAEKTSAIIRKIKETMGDKMLVGAGTVVDEAYAVAAQRAGAEFLLSPDTNPDIIRLTKKLGLVSIPGAFTPSEAMTAYRAGADIVKLFPITKDDIGYLINITRPLSHIPFLCTGGVNPDTIGSFFTAGACAVGTGISILKPERIAARDFDGIAALTKLHIDRMNEARKEL